MKCHFKVFFFTLLALAAVVFSGTVLGRTRPEAQQPKAAPQSQAQEAEPEYSEDEYNAYDSAAKEPDLGKRGAMLLGFIEKYPKSKLMSYIDSAYKSLLYECSNSKKYQELETLGDQWRKLHPNDLQTIAYVAEAAEKLGHDEKCIQCLLDIYKMQPTGSMAYTIAETYKKIKNSAKFLEWTDTIFKYPEYDSDYKLRYDLVQYYVDAKDFPKAAEWARMTLKAADLVKQPSAGTQEQLRGIRRACYHLIGVNLFEQGKFADAIKDLQLALKAEKYGEGYYYIGLCQWKQDKVEDAMLSFAKAEQQGGEAAPKAKEKLEQLYKALHNNTLIGIDKIYKRAKEQPDPAP